MIVIQKGANSMSDKTISYGIIGILLLSGLGAYILTPEQLANASTCTSTNITGIFERFSSTNVTAYWSINGSTKSSICSKGKWIPTNDWLKLNNLTAKDISIGPVDEANLTEDNVEVITIGEEIVVDKSKSISINGQVYNISYTASKPLIKCICDKATGCQISECLQ
jgi:hypothetical protein